LQSKSTLAELHCFTIEKLPVVAKSSGAAVCCTIRARRNDIFFLPVSYYNFKKIIRYVDKETSYVVDSCQHNNILFFGLAS
jgi:hypothetical protein